MLKFMKIILALYASLPVVAVIFVQSVANATMRVLTATLLSTCLLMLRMAALVTRPLR
jgi:hypothetical protein